jgi:hypothetical protein
MRINPKSDTEAREASRDVLFRADWYNARIADVAEAGNGVINDYAATNASVVHLRSASKATGR